MSALSYRTLANEFALSSVLAVAIAVATSALAYGVAPPKPAALLAPPAQSAQISEVPAKPAPQPQVPLETVPSVLAAQTPAAPTASQPVEVSDERLIALSGAIAGYPVIKRMVDRAMVDGRLDDGEHDRIKARVRKIKQNQAVRNWRRSHRRRR
jgi:uncharacterized membrane protein YebE (DUF533 family)